VSLCIPIGSLLGGVLSSLERSRRNKDKMKGQKAQRSKYRKCYEGRERDQDEHEEC
jgi:hypothetical protein